MGTSFIKPCSIVNVKKMCWSRFKLVFQGLPLLVRRAMVCFGLCLHVCTVETAHHTLCLNSSRYSCTCPRVWLRFRGCCEGIWTRYRHKYPTKYSLLCSLSGCSRNLHFLIVLNSVISLHGQGGTWHFSATKGQGSERAYGERNTKVRREFNKINGSRQVSEHRVSFVADVIVSLLTLRPCCLRFVVDHMAKSEATVNQISRWV